MGTITTTESVKMKFGTDAGTRINLQVSDIVADLTGETVSNAMNSMIERAVLADSQGNLAALAEGASKITVKEEELF